MPSGAERRKSYRRAVEKYRQRMLDHPTKAELIIKTLLDNANLKYEFQKILEGRLWKERRLSIVDFYFPEIKTILEIDGGYHNNFKQSTHDYLRTVRLASPNDIKHILRYNNDEVFKDPQPIIEKITSLIRLAENHRIQQQILRTKVKKGPPLVCRNERIEAQRRKRYRPRSKEYSAGDYSQEQLNNLIPKTCK